VPRACNDLSDTGTHGPRTDDRNKFLFLGYFNHIVVTIAPSR
jgi:hypothetical protein